MSKRLARDIATFPEMNAGAERHLPIRSSGGVGTSQKNRWWRLTALVCTVFLNP